MFPAGSSSSSSSTTDQRAFTIAAHEIAVKSPKPRHVKARFTERQPTSIEQQESASNAAEHKRQELLQARRHRLSERYQRIQATVDKVKQQQAEQLTDLKQEQKRRQTKAERTRRQLVRQQRQQCSEKIAHVKQVHQRIQTQSERQTSRLRTEMAERMHRMDIRRQIVMSKIPRSKLLDGTVVESEIIRNQNSAKRIQRWWRRHRLQPLMNAVKKTELTGPSVKEMTFDALVGRIQNAAVVKAFSRLLVTAKKFSAAGRSRRYKNPTKVFLSAYLIVYHTSEIMPELRDDEKVVKQSAIKMLEDFEAWLNIGEIKFATFMESWNMFHVQFEEWKARDTDMLLQNLSDHFMQMEKLMESVQDQVDFETQWKPQIEKQQQVIKAKVHRIGGHKAVQKLLESQQLYRESSASEMSESDNELGPGKRRRTASSSSQLRPNSVMNSPYEISHSSTAADLSEPQPQEISEFGHMVTNERLAHELIMDPDFELSNKADPNSLQGQVVAMAKKAFFDKIREDVKAERFEWAIGMIEDIRTQLMEMLPENSKVGNEIKEGLDIHLIEQQVKSKAVNIPALVQFITGKMLQLCAPVRDPAIRAILEESDIVTVFEKVMTTLEEMKMDLANFRLQSLKPHLVKQAVEYERNKFENAINAKRVSLDVTKKWLTGAVQSQSEKRAARNPEGVDIPENQVRFEAVYYNALLSLIFSPEALSGETCPETLMMDAERIMKYQNEAQAITVVAALIMLTKNFVPEIRDDRQAMEKMKDNLFVLLQAADTTIDNLSLYIVSAVSEVLGRSNKTITEEQQKLIRTMVDKTLSYKDTVYMLLNRRMQSAIQQQLSTGKFRKDVNNGLETVVTEVEQLSRKVFLLARHNRDVHAPWYDQIIREAVEQQQEQM